jgi:hypothetical protein
MDRVARLLIGLQVLDEDTQRARVAAMPPDIKADLYSTIQTRLHSQLRTTNSATTYLKRLLKRLGGLTSGPKRQGSGQAARQRRCGAKLQPEGPCRWGYTEGAAK